MNYDELQQLIANYMHRTDLAAQIPGFIEIARARINRVFSGRTMGDLLVKCDAPQPERVGNHRHRTKAHGGGGDHWAQNKAEGRVENSRGDRHS